MTREYVVNQLVYYLNYGFISKDLQEDIQEVLLKKKDINVLERVLDSVEYELNKKSKNNYNKFNNPINPKSDIKQNNIITTENKINKKNINKNFNLESKSNNTLNIEYKNKKSDNIVKTINKIKRKDIVLDEITLNDNITKKKQFKITPNLLKLFDNNNKKKNKNL